MTRAEPRIRGAAGAATTTDTAAPAVSTEAKNYVAAPSGIVSTQDMEVGQIPDRVMRSTGEAAESLDRMDLAKISETPMDQDWIANMAFMAEMITIRVPESNDKDADHVFEININGKPFFFRRGEDKTVPRYVADHMLRMKQTGYSQKEVINAEGIKDIVHPSRTHLKYDLMIVRDANPIGPDWYKATISMRG